MNTINSSYRKYYKRKKIDESLYKNKNSKESDSNSESNIYKTVYDDYKSKNNNEFMDIFNNEFEKQSINGNNDSKLKEIIIDNINEICPNSDNEENNNKKNLSKKKQNKAKIYKKSRNNDNKSKKYYTCLDKHNESTTNKNKIFDNLKIDNKNFTIKNQQNNNINDINDIKKEIKNDFMQKLKHIITNEISLEGKIKIIDKNIQLNEALNRNNKLKNEIINLKNELMQLK